MFKDIIQEKKEVVLDVSSFISKVSHYNSLDLALSELPEVYINFYASNQKVLDKALNKLNLLEAAGAENPGYLGWAPSETVKHKTIKYKGELIILTFDPDIGSWSAIPHFRSVVQALKYGKSLVDEIK